MRSLMRLLGPGLGRFARGERGTQLVELALVLPILMAFFVATAEFGRYFYSYSTLAKATRAGARYLATTPVKGVSGGQGTNVAEDMKVKRLVVYGDPNADGATKPIVPGLTVDNVEVARAGKKIAVPDTVTVRIVNYKYAPLLNLGSFANGLKWTAVPLKPSTTMRFMLTQPTPPA
ncbi:MAG TPA: TadE family protein [Pyrinomonadaceae bacterium]